MASEAFQYPLVLRCQMAQQVAVACLGDHAKKSRTGRIPAVLNLHDGDRALAELQHARRFIRLIARVALDLHNFHGHYPLVSSDSAFQAAPRKTITAEICIQISKPITAARPPYTTLYGTRRT